MGKALQRLRDDFGISGKSLVTFMSGSVAARLDDEKFWKSLQRLGDDFGISGTNLVNLMSDSIAARLSDAIFVDGLLILFSSISPRSTVTLMKNSALASTLKPPLA